MNGTEKQNETSMEMPAEDSRVTMGNQTEKKHRFHLKMPQKGRKHSVKKRIAYTFIATMAATLLIIGLINYFFLGSFYIRDKEHILAESFQKLNATGGDSDNIPDTFEQFCVTNNLKVIITGPELSSFVYSNATDRQSLQTLIFGLISGNEQANTKVVDSKDNYQIQKFYDSHADAEYLQIIGWFDNGNCYFARCPLESITDAVGLSNQFYLFIGIPIIIIGGIRIGIFTATEAGAVAILYAAFLGFIYHEMHIKDMIQGLKETVCTTASIMLIVSAASVFSWILTKERIPQALTAWMLANIHSKYVFLIVVNIFLLIVGMFIEGNASMIILVPLLAPIAAQYGINEIQFAMIYIFNNAIGALSPPMGTLMFVTCSITKCKTAAFIKEAVPFYILLIINLMLLTWVEPFTTFLVNLFY